MKIYLIQAKDKGVKIFDYLPELTASEYAAEKRRKQLEEQGMDAFIAEYEVKTQGVNFHSIAQTTETFNI